MSANAVSKTENTTAEERNVVAVRRFGEVTKCPTHWEDRKSRVNSFPWIEAQPGFAFSTSGEIYFWYIPEGHHASEPRGDDALCVSHRDYQPPCNQGPRSLRVVSRTCEPA